MAGTLQRILVVVAHPDDVDFGVAGSVACWADDGIDVTYCICTDGQAGGFEPDRDRADMPRVRRAEQRAAAGHVGVSDVRFLGAIDGELEPSLDLVREISRVIRDVRPQRVVCQSPERRWDSLHRSHPDHMAAGEATVRAVYPAARNPFAFPELMADGLADWVVHDLWIMEHPQSAHAVDITDGVDRKIAALMEHRSQHHDQGGLAEGMRRQMLGVADRHEMPPGRSAEEFFVVRVT